MRKLGFREVSHLPDDTDSEWRSRMQRAQHSPVIPSLLAHPAHMEGASGPELLFPEKCSGELPEGAGEGHVPSLGKRQ